MKPQARLRRVVSMTVTVLLLVAPAAAAGEADKYETHMPGVWTGTEIHDPALGFTQTSLRLLRHAKVNQTAGSLRLSAPGGKTVCRARLVLLDPTGLYTSGAAEFAVKYQRGATAKVRQFCKPQTRGDRLYVALLWPTTNVQLTSRDGERTGWSATKR
jgi:hypothetical protein